MKREKPQKRSKYESWARMRRRKDGRFAKGNRGGPGRPPLPKPAPDPPLILPDGTLNPQHPAMHDAPR